MEVPLNIEEPDILRSYLNELNAAINGITVINRSLNGSGTSYSLKQNSLSANKEFLKFVADANKLSNEIKRLVEDNLVTITKTKALATAVTEQFGSFSESALAASWYGLSVTAGGTVAGFTVGAIDTDTTTPGTESSFFAIEADRFTVGKSHNLTPEEAQAVAASNENYLTLYDSNGFAVPAFGINFNSATNRYEIYFNGTVNFVNIEDMPDYITDNAFTTWLQDYYDELVGDVNILKAQTDGKIEYYFILSTATDPATAWITEELRLAHHGDIKYFTDTKVGYSYHYANGWVQLTNTQLLESVQIASEAKATADGKITTYYGTEANRLNVTGEDGDLYICSDNKKQYIWTTSWVLIDAAQAVNSGTTKISGGKIETDSLITKHIQADANGLIINSEVVGSSATPNIQGAYIKGGTIEATTLTSATVTAPLINTGTTGYLRGGKTSYTDTTAGYFMGYYGSNYVFKMGNATKNIAWDGTNLTVTGQVIALGNLPTINNVVRHHPNNYTLSSANTWYTIAQVTISVLAGQYVDIDCDFLSNKGNNVATPSIRVLRGDTFIFGSTAIGDTNNSLYANNLASANAMSANSFTFSDLPGAGTHTYYLQVGTHSINTTPPRIDPTFTQIFMKAQVFNI